jgi:hypothetical protein
MNLPKVLENSDDYVTQSGSDLLRASTFYAILNQADEPGLT